MGHFKSCSKCGKIHDINYECKAKKVYQGGEERNLRSKWKWTNKSKEIRERANYLCEVCRDKGLLVWDRVEVHHIKKITAAPELLLENTNLIVLCPFHHKLADDGKIDEEYLTRLAAEREGVKIPPGP